MILHMFIAERNHQGLHNHPIIPEASVGNPSARCSDLKWGYQPDGHLTSHCWSDSIRQARIQIDLLVETSRVLAPSFLGY